MPVWARSPGSATATVIGESSVGPSHGTGGQFGSRGSGRIITEVASRTSATSRQIMPWTEALIDAGARSPDDVELNTGTRWAVGFTDATPQAMLGKRREPPMSLPWCSGPIPAAAAAAAPPEEPPGAAVACQGFTVLP